MYSNYATLRCPRGTHNICTHKTFRQPKSHKLNIARQDRKSPDRNLVTLSNRWRAHVIYVCMRWSAAAVAGCLAGLRAFCSHLFIVRFSKVRISSDDTHTHIGEQPQPDERDANNNRASMKYNIRSFRMNPDHGCVCVCALGCTHMCECVPLKTTV